MIYRCEICGKVVKRTSLFSRVTADGKAKNMGECDACSKEWESKLANMVKDVVFVGDDVIVTPLQKYDIKESPSK